MEPERPESESSPPKRHRCPTCGADASPLDDAFPFCSARCRMVDLGRWLGGQYIVSREITAEDLSDEG